MRRLKNLQNRFGKRPAKREKPLAAQQRLPGAFFSRKARGRLPPNIPPSIHVGLFPIGRELLLFLAFAQIIV